MEKKEIIRLNEEEEDEEEILALLNWRWEAYFNRLGLRLRAHEGSARWFQRCGTCERVPLGTAMGSEATNGCSDIEIEMGGEVSGYGEIKFQIQINFNLIFTLNKIKA